MVVSSTLLPSWQLSSHHMQKRLGVGKAEVTGGQIHCRGKKSCARASRAAHCFRKQGKGRAQSHHQWCPRYFACLLL